MGIKTKELEVSILRVKDKIILSGGIIQIQPHKGTSSPTKLQILDRDGIATHEFILNTTDGTSGEIRHNGRIRRIV